MVARTIMHIARAGLIALSLVAMSGVAAAAGEQVAIRTGVHPGYNRLVFDWPHKVGYTLKVDGTAVTVTFNRPGTVNMAVLDGAGLTWVRDPVATESDTGLSFRFTIPEGASVSHFRDGTKVAVDVTAPPGETKVTVPEPVKRPAVHTIVADAVRTSLSPDEPGAADQPAPTPTEHAQAETPDAMPAIPAPEVATATPADNTESPAQTGDASGTAATPSAPIPVTADAAATDAAPQPTPEDARPDKAHLEYTGAPVAVRAEPVFNGVRLTYPLNEPVPAAIFQRAGYLWVIFEKYRPVNHAGLGAIAGKRILSIEQVPNPEATILRYHIASDQHVVAHRRDSAWVVELKDNETAPKIPLEIGQYRYNGAPAVFIPVSDVGSRIDITDPAVGDTITVVPALPAGRGVADTRRFAQFNVLRSAQGVAVQVLADGVEVERFRNGVAVAAQNGLALSPDQNAPVFAGVQEHKATTPDKPQRLIDFAAWRRGGAGDFDKVRQELLHRLSLAPKDELNGARWDLARFYLGHDMAARALGILQVMVADDPDLLDNAEYRAVRGVANLQLRRFTDGRNDLAFKGLDTEPDAYLWRAVASAGLGQWQDALDNYRAGSDVLAGYDDEERIRFEMTALKAAEHLHDTATMEEEIKVLDGFLLPPETTAEVAVLRAKMYLMNGDRNVAMRTLKKVEAAGERPSAAEAAFTRIEEQLKDDKLAKKDAIDQLERLRFAWRGDKFELDLLDQLGQLYIDTGDYHAGFNALRQAVTHFPKSPRTREITAVMSKAFEKLFLDGRANSLPPVEALGLYYDFRELTPLGADGDQMIRRLVDRLVSVDLLGRAAELLEHQVRYRLQGVAQAQVAGRLAMIYLMDQKPDKALEVIRATRQTLIPDDVALGRRHLEARALIDLKHYEEADVLLEDDKTPDARLLRADLYWNAGQWKKVVANGEAVLGKRWEQQRPLTNDERRQILRMAVAQSLDDNADGLASLRKHYDGLMQNGAYASAFDVITAKQDPSEREIKQLTESIASVNTLEGFMASYRNEFNGS